MAVSVTSVAYSAAGGILLYSGITGDTVGNAVRSVLKGKKPSGTVTAPSSPASPAGPAGTAAPGNTGASSASAAANQATARLLAVSMGHPTWIVGQQWADWLSLWNQESNWQDEANPGSDARGIAQKITGYDSAYQQGNLPQQIAWGISYIARRYPGGPSEAWSHEESNGWY